MGKKKTKKDKRNNELKWIFFIILVAAALFIVSTYAWFSTQRNVSITNLNGTVEVAEGLEISLNAKNWYNGIVLGDGEGELSITDVEGGDVYATATGGCPNISPSEMLPVSTTGKVSTGMKKLKLLTGKVTDTIKLDKIVATDETMPATEDNSEKAVFPGYFAFDIFLKNSSKSNSIEDILQLNYDSSLQILEAEGGEDKSITGLQNTVRVALVKYGGGLGGDGNRIGVVDSTVTDQGVILNSTGALKNDIDISDVAIWEPNSSDHVDYIVENNNRITWPSTHALAGQLFIKTTQMETYALADAAIGKTMADLYDWDIVRASAPNAGIIEKQNVLQTTTQKDASGAITSYNIAEGVKNLKSTSDGSTDFTIPPNKIIRFRVYVWLEGQDVDCINYASHGGGVTLNLGLVKGSTEGTFAPEEE